MPNDAAQIAANLKRVREEIARAAEQSGRDESAITLVAVTKYVSSTEVRTLYDAGCRDFGESRPQELWRKAAELPKLDAHWHMIGHLQRNKARRTLLEITLLHSLDSIGLLDEIERQSAPPVAALIEINVSGDASKHGVAPDEAESFLLTASRYRGVRIQGLMTMAAREGDPAGARANFSELRDLRDKLRRVAPPEVELDELSMGMSGDYAAAIEEGATIVRIGSALFEGMSTRSDQT